MKTEIKVFSAENPERLKFLPLKPGEGHNIDMRTSPTARNFFLSYSYTTKQSKNPNLSPDFFLALGVALMCVCVCVCASVCVCVCACVCAKFLLNTPGQEK